MGDYFITVVKESLKEFLPKIDTSQINIEEIGDGNINYIFKVSYQDQNYICKCGPPYIKILGEGYPLDVNRSRIEYNALSTFHSVINGCVPKPLFFDKGRNLVCMSYLDGYEIMRKRLIAGFFDMSEVEMIARNIGAVHKATHVSKLTSEEFEGLKNEFKNEDMCNLTRQYVFTGPFQEDDCDNTFTDQLRSLGRLKTQIYDNKELLKNVEDLKVLFCSKQECLIHGDLHTGSVMVKDGDAKIIDNEFACLGPAAFDLGMLIAQYIFSYYQHMSTPEDNDRHRRFAYKMIDACRNTVSSYFDCMDSYIGDKETYRNELMSETAGFAGCEIVRRIIGVAHVEDLEGKDHAAADALGSGVRLLAAYKRIHDVDKFLIIALMLAY